MQRNAAKQAATSFTHPTRLLLVSVGLDYIACSLIEIVFCLVNLMFYAINQSTLQSGHQLRTITKIRRKLWSIHYLILDHHRHIHEHVVQFFDWILQFDDVSVSRLNISERLFGLVRVHDNLNHEMKWDVFVLECGCLTRFLWNTHSLCEHIWAAMLQHIF